jgi:hypothetical protein
LNPNWRIDPATGSIGAWLRVWLEKEHLGLIRG